MVVEYRQDVVTLLDIHRGCVRAAPFKVQAGPGPYVVVGIDVCGFELGDGECCRDYPERKEVRCYGGTKRALFGV